MKNLTGRWQALNMVDFLRQTRDIFLWPCNGQFPFPRASINVFVLPPEDDYLRAAGLLFVMESESVLQRSILPDDLPQDIHHSIADADDIEEVWDEDISVSDVFRNLLHHPAQLVTRWNWKSVLLAVIVRGSFYFTVYKASHESWLVTMTAVLVEFVFRFLTAGVAGALVQSFRKAKPIWVANLIVSIILPAFSHTVEFAAHYTQEKYYNDIFAASENSGRQRTFAISVLFSVVSVLFNLYLMRNGVLLVGAGKATKSLGDDFKHIPRLASEFTVALPVLISRFLENGRILKGFGAFVAFGASVGSILGIFRWKWDWAWKSALGAWAILFVITLLTIIVRRILGHHLRDRD